MTAFQRARPISCISMTSASSTEQVRSVHGTRHRCILTAMDLVNENTQGDNDVISFRIYASWFSPPSCE